MVVAPGHTERGRGSCSALLSLTRGLGKNKGSTARGEPLGDSLAAEGQSFQHGAISGDITLGEVAEEATALTDQHQQTTACVVVLFVALEMARECIDMFCQKSNLNFCTTCVVCICTKLSDDLLLALFAYHGLNPKKEDERKPCGSGVFAYVVDDFFTHRPVFRDLCEEHVDALKLALFSQILEE